MHIRTLYRTAFCASLLASCGDDTITVATFNWTQITNGNGGSDDGPGLDTEVATTSGGGGGETFGMAETTAGSSTGPSDPTTGDATTTDDETTGAMEEGPITDPPFGCGVITEVLFNVPAGERYVVVDLSACDRPEFVRFDILAFVDKVAFSVQAPAPGPCAALGSAGSLVTLDTGFAATGFGSLELSSFSLSLWVDDVQTDNVRVTPVLQGQQWGNMPAAPDEPMRRAEDFSWRVLPDHVQGCALLVL